MEFKSKGFYLYNGSCPKAGAYEAVITLCMWNMCQTVDSGNY
jgi:hypothetical protein